KYLGPEDDVKVRGNGRFDTHVFNPQLVAGEIFKEGDEMKVYVSNDDNHIPVMITSPVRVGEVRAVLSNTRGLRHPLSSKR
ncbi:MAG: DUF3108 domain-containing protein, partial [Bacteroidota bacterium]